MTGVQCQGVHPDRYLTSTTDARYNLAFIAADEPETWRVRPIRPENELQNRIFLEVVSMRSVTDS